MPEAKRKTVLFFPLNSPGHVNGSVAIADRLKLDHNYRTVFLLLGPSIGKTIEENGHELVTLEEKKPHEDYEVSADEMDEEPDEALKESQGKKKKQFLGVFKWAQVIQRYRGIMHLEPLEACIKSLPFMEKIMVDELITNHDSFVEAIESIKPDLIVVDAYYIPPCVVAGSIPWVRVYSANPLGLYESAEGGKDAKPTPMIGFSLMKSKEIREKVRLEEPERWQAIQHEWKTALQRFVEAAQKCTGHLQEFMKVHGCEPVPPGKQAHDSPHVNFYMYPKALDYVQDDDLFKLPNRWINCDALVRGASIKPNKDTQVWLERLNAAKEAGKEIVYFSLGTIASGDVALLTRLIAFFKTDSQAQQDKRLYIISKGVNGDRIDLGDSENIVGANYLPQTTILEHADIAIVHGGNNSITECLYAGIPMIVLPVFADQYDNAQRIEDLELGKRLDVLKCTKEEILGAIVEILKDQSITKRYKEISENMKARDELDKISAILHKLIEDKKLEQSFIDRYAKS